MTFRGTSCQGNNPLDWVCSPREGNSEFVVRPLGPSLPCWKRSFEFIELLQGLFNPDGVDVKTAAELMCHPVELFLARYFRSDRALKMKVFQRLQKGEAAV